MVSEEGNFGAVAEAASTDWIDPTSLPESRRPWIAGFASGPVTEGGITWRPTSQQQAIDRAT